ncbi:acyltransferase family protein [Aestuariibius insulae]|uniref:acyltransferase family protein n=1 Tax=Aestuariibius insulae TaxID=2058287 RepID=UPI00345E505C
MLYRPEIDGLRAVAVVPVILFHSGLGLFSGGFIGVDIFFVISGYLITTLLIEDIERGSFSLLEFYERRARRILPALFFVCAACLPFAWLWMLPEQLRDFSQSLVAVGLFASNILFWRESGYFSEAAEDKPLLHTWSLAVEEQYYIIFPILLLLIWRSGPRRVLWILIALSGASLALSEWAWRTAPSANFYLIPTRAWELFAGSIAALHVHRSGLKSNGAIAVAGLFLILAALVTFDETVPVPGLPALLPVAGTVLVLLYGHNTPAARLLGLPFLTGIGLISYSAYLWHQPLFAFARIGSLEPPGLPLMLGLALASFPLAWLSWRFVERPFRRRGPGAMPRRMVFAGSASGLAAVAAAGAVLWTATPPDDLLRETYGGACNYNGGRCFEIEEAPLKVALWGDSFADAFSTSLGRQLNEDGISLALFIRHSCPSLTGVLRNEDARQGPAFKHDCLEHTRASMEELRTGDYDIVVLNSAYEWYASETNMAGEPILVSEGPGSQYASQPRFVAERLAATIAELDHAGRAVVLLTPHPMVREETFLRYRKMRHRGIEGDFSADYASAARIHAQILEATQTLDVTRVSGLDLFCEGAPCPILTDAGGFTLFDGYHLSSSIAPDVARRLTRAIEALGQARSMRPLASRSSSGDGRIRRDPPCITRPSSSSSPNASCSIR